LSNKKIKIVTILTLIIIIAASSIVIIQLNSQQKTAQIIRVACVGDSITEWSHYPEKLQKLLGDKYEVANFGVAGSAVTKTSDKPYMNQDAFQQAKDFQPQIVIIMLGTNDAKDFNFRNIGHFPNDYEDLIGQYDALPDDQLIWVVMPPPIYDNNLGLNSTNLEQGVIPKIAQVAGDMNLPTIDVHSAMINRSDYFIDGVHPNTDGADVIATTISDAIIQDNIVQDTADTQDAIF
jgi:acyl-CoA thioesterase I